MKKCVNTEKVWVGKCAKSWESVLKAVKVC